MEKRADSADISVLFFFIAVLFFWLYTRKQTVLCTVLLALYYLYCAVSTVQLALCYEHCAFITVLLALCYQNYAKSSMLGLIQGNSRCFGAHCKMSRNTRFLCYYFGLKYSSVLFSTRFPSLLCPISSFLCFNGTNTHFCREYVFFGPFLFKILLDFTLTFLGYLNKK